ncbi:MAG: cation diffusion facilitator family transporter [Gammaproteobacteria bacterium]|nr:cation diffusion facilitator family transporter [Gammaproteobacteria bacterium]
MKRKSGSVWVVLAAMIGNGLIAITKFIAVGITGSSAMLSEAVHSVVDTGNQGLLLWGMNRASRPADERHPFGYGMELYFWAFVVAILIFAIGAGVSLYEGIHKLLEPKPVLHPIVNYVVLGTAMIFEAFAWIVAFREFRRNKKKTQGYFEAVQSSKDPTVFTVLFEDSAAMLGLICAFIGVFLTEHLADPRFDALASIGISIILAGTAAVLAYESKGLLIGEAASDEVRVGIRRILAEESGIIGINEILTMHLGPQDVLLTVSLDFSDEMSSADVEEKITQLETIIRSKFPEIARIFIEAQSQFGHLRNVRRFR